MKCNKEEMEREFVCPKCRQHGGLVQEVKLERGRTLIPLSATRYWAISCGLCGYTEFYHLGVLEKAGEEAPAGARLAADKSE